MFHVKHSASLFDVIVVGAGHAGCEAACAAARRGARVAMVSFSADNIGEMSCNPSIGGVGKGHLVRELDVFDGLMARAADASAIHHRMLNRSKGPAVRGPRIQADRQLFRAAVKRLVRDSGVSFIRGEVEQLYIAANGRVSGVVLTGGGVLGAPAVILASGTFLGGKLFRGTSVADGGRYRERSASRLADQLAHRGLAVGRLKTGTPPRLDGRSIDWARLERQPSDADDWRMSVGARGRRQPQLDCAITRTTHVTHQIIAENFALSPLFAGAIEGRGPRYCPSIEDKVKRFSDRNSHQIFLEPEGLNSSLVYPNGLSTSLPDEVQHRFVRSIPGLERATIARPGYAVEYGFCDARQLRPTLEHRDIAGLFLGGQINGTTGYEEAAAQGLVAGLNAAAVARDLSRVAFDRASSYIGVLVDDLTTHGVTEPYRMMTARAEFRLHLRADNATERLGEAALAANCVSDERKAIIESRMSDYEAARAALDGPAAQLAKDPGARGKPLRDWLARSGSRDSILNHLGRGEAAEVAVTDAEYEPYLARQRDQWASLAADRRMQVPDRFNFHDVPGLSSEMAERLSSARPDTLHQAGKVRGISPAALSALHFALARGG